MANLEETREWAEGIYQLEKTDRVLGGTDGVANRQGQQLANRTLWLKEKVESTESALTEHKEADDPHPQYVTEQKMTDYVGTVIVQGQVNADWNATDGAAYIKNKPELSAVATSGNYADLNGKPILATVATSGSYNDLQNKPSTMSGATEEAAGTSGLVPAPASGDENKVLRGDGTWSDMAEKANIALDNVTAAGIETAIRWIAPNYSAKVDYTSQWGVSIPANSYGWVWVRSNATLDSPVEFSTDLQNFTITQNGDASVGTGSGNMFFVLKGAAFTATGGNGQLRQLYFFPVLGG